MLGNDLLSLGRSKFMWRQCLIIFSDTHNPLANDFTIAKNKRKIWKRGKLYSYGDGRTVPSSKMYLLKGCLWNCFSNDVSLRKKSHVAPQ